MMVFLPFIASLMMERVRENIVALAKQNPAGIPLKQLAVVYNKRYRHNLSLSSLGFDSMVSLVDSLDSDLVLVGQLIHHKDHLLASKGINGAGAAAAAEATERQKILENVVSLIKEHPDGIPLKKVAVVYSQKYHHNLALASLGFKTISNLVTSLKELVVREEDVFHETHWLPRETVPEKSANKDSRPATPQRTESPKAGPPVTAPHRDVCPPSVPSTQAAVNCLGPTPVSTALLTTPWPPDKQTNLTLDQLYRRVVEVSHEDKINYYFHIDCVFSVCLFVLTNVHLSPVLLVQRPKRVGIVHFSAMTDTNVAL